MSLAPTVTNTTQLNNTLTVGASDTGYDVKFWGDTANNYMLWDTSEDALHLVTTDASTSQLIIESTDNGSNHSPDISIYRNSDAPVDNDTIGRIIFHGEDSGSNKTLYAAIQAKADDVTAGSESGRLEFRVAEYDGGATTGLRLIGSATVNNGVDVEIPSGNLQVAGTTQLNNTLTVGVNDTGYDVKFFGDADGHYMLWDTSAEALKIVNDGIRAAIILENTEDGATNSPGMTFYRNSSSPADNDIMGVITFLGNDADESGGTVQDTENIYGRIQSKLISAVDDEEASELNIGVMSLGDFKQSCIQITGQSDDASCNITLGNDAGSAIKVTGWFAANNATPAAAPNWTVNHYTGTDRSFDKTADDLDDTKAVLARLIQDLQATGLLGTSGGGG